MIAAWMLYTLATSAVLLVAMLAGDHVCRAIKQPMRILWLSAMLVATLLAARSLAATRQPRAIAVMLGPSVTRAADSGAPSAFAPSVVRPRANASRPTSRRYQRMLASLDGFTSRLSAFDRPAAAIALASSIIALLHLLLAFVRLRRIEATLGVRSIDGESVLISPDLGPALLGVIAPRIVVPEWLLDLSPNDRSLILAHERGHAAARDPLISFVGTVLVALQPWNLPLWMMRDRLRLAIETDCDRRVLDAFRDIRRYAELLITVHERSVPGLSPAVAFVERPSNLEHRVREMTRRRVVRITPRLFLVSMVTGMLAFVACVTPEPRPADTAGTSPVALASATATSSITGGGQCVNWPNASPPPALEQLRGRALRKLRSSISRDSLIGFLLDENCTVIRDTAVAMPSGSWNERTLIQAAFPREASSIGRHIGVMWVPNGPKTPAKAARQAQVIVYGVRPSAAWTTRRAEDQCGFGARSDEFCSVAGTAALRRVDSTRLVIVVRGTPVNDSTAAPTEHFFLVSSQRPLPAALTQRIRFARVMYQNNSVYVEDRASLALPLVFGSFGPAIRHLLMPRITYDTLIGIAHYRSPGVTLENIDRLRHARTCDGPVGACYEVNGTKINFPG